MVVEVSLSGHPLVYLKKTNKQKETISARVDLQRVPALTRTFWGFRPHPLPGALPAAPSPKSLLFFFCKSPRCQFRCCDKVFCTPGRPLGQGDPALGSSAPKVADGGGSGCSGGQASNVLTFNVSCLF